MTERTLPNVGLKGGYDPGENGWGPGMVDNLLILSVLTQGTVIDKVAAEPGSPAAGDTYILDETHATRPNEIAVFDGPTGEEAWFYIAPGEGWILFNQTDNRSERFDGTVWKGEPSYGRKVVEIPCTDPAGANLAVGNGQGYFVIPPELNGMNLVAVAAALVGAQSTSGTPTIMVANQTDAVDMLSTPITIDANEWTSYTAATAAVIDATKDDVATGDIIRLDVDVAGTGAKGLIVILTFQLP